MKQSENKKQKQRPLRNADGQSDPKVLKSYRLKQSVVRKIERLRIAAGQRYGKVPSAAEVLENLVLEKDV